jgi:hypothetical protein
MNNKSSSEPNKEAFKLYMVEKYERVVDYLYPIAQSIPRNK